MSGISAAISLSVFDTGENGSGNVKDFPVMRRPTPSAAVQSGGSSNIVSIAPFPFSALRVLDVFCFDSSVREYTRSADYDEFDQVKTSKLYVVTGREFRRYRSSDAVYVSTDIALLQRTRASLGKHGFFRSLNPKWRRGSDFGLFVRRIGNFSGIDDTRYIPDVGDYLRSSKGTLCPKAKVETLQAVFDLRLPGGGQLGFVCIRDSNLTISCNETSFLCLINNPHREGLNTDCHDRLSHNIRSPPSHTHC